ncbi:MAG: hypothetical protein JNL92_07720, partial [Opitutaceae bacterium]|nr:hypothetical protein [Opitutaceae bacterium]
TRSGTPARLAASAVETSGRFALVFTGSLVVPRAGDYRFALESSGLARLQINGQSVVEPLDRMSQPGIVRLAAGRQTFRLDLVHSSNARPSLEWLAEGPGIAPHAVTVRENRPARTGPAPKRVRIEPDDRTVVQRGFVPFAPRKRLYAASIGTPAGAHFAYDFETGAVLRAWRGSFINAADMWEGRGADQTARPEGPALTFSGKPALAVIEYAALGDWPDQPEPLWSSQGYTLEPDGTPVFLGTLAELTLRDRITAVPEGKGLLRTQTLSGRLPSWSTWLLLAEADTITPQPGGGWVIGDREWYLDWPAGAPHRPVVRTVGARQQLAVPVTGGTLEKPITYTLVW